MSSHGFGPLCRGFTEDGCGEPVIEFVLSTGFALPSIFTVQCELSGACVILVWTNQIEYCIDYNLQFNFYYSLEPSIVVISNVFIVTIINPCVPPPLCIIIIGCGIDVPVVNPPTVDIHIDVTVTINVDYTLPTWNCGNPGCDTQIIPVCVDCSIEGQTDIVILVENTITINIEACGSWCVDNPTGSVYVIVIEGCLGTICVPVDCEVVIHNPCLDPDYYQIMPIDLETINYTPFQTGQFTHPLFPIQGTQHMIDLCGDVIYSVDFSAGFGIYVSYDVDLHIIIITCDDYSVVPVGSYTYTVTVTLNIYTSVTVSSGGTIIIVDPCQTCVLVAGTAINLSIIYEQTATFTFPSLTVTPAPCVVQAVYSCEYLQGPYSGPLNLCGFDFANGNFNSAATFDITTGAYTFITNDMTTFAEGIYHFRITATIGTRTTSVTFTITIVNACPTVMPAILNNPFINSPYAYTIYNQPLEIPFDLTLIGNIGPSVICGNPMITFVTASGSPAIPSIFNADIVGGKLIVGPSSDTIDAGQVYLRYKYFNSLRPDQFTVSPVFKFVITDSCNPPVAMIPPVYDPQVYTIGQPAIMYQVPQWGTDPSFCASAIPYNE